MPSNEQKRQFREFFSLILEMSDNYYELKRLNFLVHNISENLENRQITEEQLEKVWFYLSLHEKEYEIKSQKLAEDFDCLCSQVKVLSCFLED